MSHLTDAVEQWQDQQDLYSVFDDYYRGRHQLRFASRDFQDKYARQLLTDAVMSIRENMCPAAVTAFTDGISVSSWGDDTVNRLAADIGLSRLEGFINRAGFKSGDAFAVVWPDRTGQPRPSFQRPDAMVPTVDPDVPDMLDHAARIWVDKANYGRVNIYWPDRLERYRTVDPIRQKSTDAVNMPVWDSNWTPMDDTDGDVIPHDFGVVPVCWWKRDPDDHLAHGNSILLDVIPLQDATNKSLADLIITSEAFSRPLMYLLNFRDDAPKNPFAKADQPKPSKKRFDPTGQQILTLDGGGPFGRLDPPDMTKVLRVQDAFATKVARVIGAPSYYFSQTSGDVPSGESLRVLSTRRTATIKAWQRDAEPVWRGLLQLLGVDDPTIEWADPMPLDPLEKAQVAQAKKALGYSLEDIAAFLGETDVDGIVQRAQQASAESAQALGRSLMNGNIDYSS